MLCFPLAIHIWKYRWRQLATALYVVFTACNFACRCMPLSLSLKWLNCIVSPPMLDLVPVRLVEPVKFKQCFPSPFLLQEVYELQLDEDRALAAQDVFNKFLSEQVSLKDASQRDLLSFCYSCSRVSSWMLSMKIWWRSVNKAWPKHPKTCLPSVPGKWIRAWAELLLWRYVCDSFPAKVLLQLPHHCYEEDPCVLLIAHLF